MIKIEVAEGYIKVTGHAGYAPKGKDIVCASISALTLTLMSSLELVQDIEYFADDGIAEIRYKDLNEQGKLLIRSFLIGVDIVADEYSEYVQALMTEKAREKLSITT